MKTTWLEVALNGPWSREKQAGMPVAVDEIVAEGIACARAGAAIVHVHAYDETTGRQRDDADIYARIIEDIRAEVDVIVYPTIPLAGSIDSPDMISPKARFAAVESLARRGLVEWSIVDPGSVNFAHRDDIAADRPGFTYLNPETHIRHGLALAREHGFHPGYACYEPGFVRTGAALATREPGVPQPVYRFIFSDDYTFSFPPRTYGLDAYLALLEEVAPGAPWFAAGLGVDIRPLIAEVVARGGHLRVGLEDAPFGTELTNVQWVEDAAARIATAGGTLATASNVRNEIGTASG